MLVTNVVAALDANGFTVRHQSLHARGVLVGVRAGVQARSLSAFAGEFKAGHPEIDWRRIYGVRCHLVHGYEMASHAEITWDAIERCIPPLKKFCETYFER